MRRACFLRCAAAASSGAAAAATAAVAAAATPAAASSEKAAGSKGKGDGGSSKSTVSRTSFSTFKFLPWQLDAVEDRESVPPVILYHGKLLGPRPLVILDHSLAPSSTEEEMRGAAAKFELILSHLQWAHGAVYVPLRVDTTGGAGPDVLGVSCRHVCGVLDGLNVRWSNFLTHSYGTLVAARMATSAEHPHRVGSVLSLDSPLTSGEIVRNMRRRREIARAEEDVNVPAVELSFAKESLLEELEPVLPCAAAADRELFEKYLFDPKTIFGAGGLTRDESRYVPTSHLEELHHPLQLIVPASAPVLDVGAHKDLFGIRRPATIKSAAGHDDLFNERGASEVAAVVSAWVSRFEPDVTIKRRYEQAAKEMAQLMGSSSSGGADAAGGASAAAGGKEGGKKKKEKKKKG